MVQFLSIIFFLGILQFLLGFSKVPVFCVTLYNCVQVISFIWFPYQNIYMCAVQQVPHALPILSTCSQYGTKYEPPQYEVTFPYFLLLHSHIFLCRKHYL